MLLKLPEVNRKEIEESTGLYMDAGTGTKKELYRQAPSAGEEGSLLAARLDSTVDGAGS